VKKKSKRTEGTRPEKTGEIEEHKPEKAHWYAIVYNAIETF
jgi:hypothetical protein